MSNYYSHSQDLFFFYKYSKILFIQNPIKSRILLTRCPIINFILIFFSFHKYSKLDNIFLSGNQLLFSSQILVLNLHASIELPINKKKSIFIPQSDLVISSNGYYLLIGSILSSFLSFLNCFL